LIKSINSDGPELIPFVLNKPNFDNTYDWPTPIAGEYINGCASLSFFYHGKWHTMPAYANESKHSITWFDEHPQCHRFKRAQLDTCILLWCKSMDIYCKKIFATTETALEFYQVRSEIPIEYYDFQKYWHQYAGVIVVLAK
jgi:hypothetical protein